MLLLPTQIVHLAVKMTALATLSGTRYAAVANANCAFGCCMTALAAL